MSRSVILNWYRSSDFVGRGLRVFGDIQSKTSACSASKNLTTLAWTAIRRFLWTLRCVHGGFAGRIVERVQFVPGHANDLGAFAGLLDLLLQCPVDLRELEQGFTL